MPNSVKYFGQIIRTDLYNIIAYIILTCISKRFISLFYFLKSLMCVAKVVLSRCDKRDSQCYSYRCASTV